MGGNTQTHTQTYAQTAVPQYSTESEQGAVEILLVKSGFSYSEVPNPTRLHAITQLAGIVRMDLVEGEQCGQSASGINAHYDDFGKVLEDLGDQTYRDDGENRDMVKKLAQLMNEAENPRGGEATSHVSRAERIREVMAIVRGSKMTLTKDDTFALGVALDMCAGDRDDRDRWLDREEQSSEEILEKRKITDEDVRGLRAYHDEIKAAPATFEGGQYGTTKES